MSGTDTSRGINFQYAIALGLLIDFPAHPAWETIQFEGDQDIEDAIIKDVDGRVVYKAQIKQKEDPYRWEPAELRDVIKAFAKSQSYAETEYHFIYAGAEGKSFHEDVRPLLEKAHFEGPNALTQADELALAAKLDTECVAFLNRVGSRFHLAKRETWESLEHRDLRRLRKLLADSSSQPLEEGYEERVYDKLFKYIAQKTQPRSKYKRQLDRAKVYELLELNKTVAARMDFDVPAYVRWFQERGKEAAPIIPLEMRKEQVNSEILSFVVTVAGEPQRPDLSNGKNDEAERSIPLPMALQRNSRLALIGELGSGKTSALWQAALQKIDPSPTDSEVTNVPVLLNFAGYDGEPLVELVAQSLYAAGQLVTEDVIKQIARQGRLLLLCDNVDGATTAQAPTLLAKLKRWAEQYPDSTILATTQRPSDGRNLGFPTFRLQPFTLAQAREALLTLPGFTEGDAFAILHSMPEAANHLITSPLTLKMLAYAYSRANRKIPTSRGPLYGQVVKGILEISEAKGYSTIDRSDKVSFLSRLAAWMQNQDLFTLSLSRLSTLIGLWVKEDSFAHLSSSNQLQIRTELAQSGVLRTNVDGEIEFAHSSFRAYFAALTISEEGLSLFVTAPNWRTSLVLWASFRTMRETDALVNLLGSYPTLLGEVIRERVEGRDQYSHSFEEAAQYFQRFLHFFNVFIDGFQMLDDPVWNYLPQQPRKLIVAQSGSSGYVLRWQTSEDPGDVLELVGAFELKALLADETKPTYPVWLLPKATMNRYHPLELVYLWIMRSLYELVELASWDIDPIRQGGMVHPLSEQVLMRYWWYREFAGKLPHEVRQQLPFYATSSLDLFVDIYEASEPPIIRYVVRESHEQGKDGLIQSFVGGVGAETPMLKYDEADEWQLSWGNTTEPVALVHEIKADELALQVSPSSVAQDWIKANLKTYFVGYPPQAW